MAKIVFYDGNALVHRAYHAIKPLTTSRGELTNAVFGFATMLFKTIGDLRPEYGAATFDKRGPTFRHEAYSGYKANRARMADDLAPQFSRVRELIDAFGMPIYELAGFEADDLLGTLARQALERGLEVYLVTGDTDALQLVRPGVQVLIPSRGVSEAVLYDENGVRERYGLEPIQVIDYKALKGDPSDNIKGVPGVGEKTAQKLLQRYGTIERLLELPEDLEPKWRQAIEENAEALRLGKKLTRIVLDAPVELDVEAARLDDYDRNRAIVLLRELEFRSLIDRLPTALAAPAVAPVAVAAAAGTATQGSLFDDPATSFAASSAPIGAPTQPAPVPALGQYRTVTSVDHLEELARELEDSDGFAFDTETAEPGSVDEPLIGLSFCTRVGTGWYVPVAHRNSESPQVDLDTVRARLAAVMADPAVPKIGHNAKHDLEVLHKHGFELEGLTFDSMIAAFVLDTSVRAFGLKDLAWGLLNVEMTPVENLIGKGKARISLPDVPLDLVAPYACAAADVTLRLRDKLEPRLREEGMWELFATVEMPCVPVLARMEEAGIAIDVGYFEKMAVDMGRQLADVELEIYNHVGHQFNVNSPIQLGKILFDELHLPRGKRTRTGWSTDAETLEELRGVHPVIDRLFDYRQISKLKSTYVDALPTMVGPDGRVHTSYNQIGASTGRLSSSEPNLQNIPIRSEQGRAVRRGFVASAPDLVLLGADYSQVELRILAHITRDEALMAAFGESQDIHRATASQIFAVEPAAVTADQRRLAKVVNYGIAYGLGDYGLSVQAGISRQEAGQFIRSYLERYPGIARYIEETKRSAESKGYVETLMGRRIHIPEIASVNRSIRAAAERRAINAPIQGSNADFMKLAMARVHAALGERGLKTRLILQVHDELVFEGPRGEVGAVGDLAREVMSSAYTLDPQLEVEIKVGTNWCDVE